MEKKPIKRHQHLIPISREHHGTLLFCWKLRNGSKWQIEKQRMSNYVAWYKDHHLLPHFKTEEILLFTNKQDPKVADALAEHEDILSLVNKAVSDTENNGNYDSFITLADLVDKHTRYEERDLFPYIEQLLSEDELERIGKALEAEEHTAEENYHDEFWVKEKK